MVGKAFNFKDLKRIEFSFKQERNLFNLLSSLKTLENDSIILLVSNDIIKKLPVSGDKINITFYTKNGIFYAQSEILQIIQGLVSTGFTVKKPDSMKHKQRRAHYRAEISAEFSISTINDTEFSQKNSLASGFTKNISQNGFSFISDYPINEFLPVNVELYFGTYTVKTLAELVYSGTETKKGKKKFINAFKFKNISSKNSEFLAKMCALYQIKSKNKTF